MSEPATDAPDGAAKDKGTDDLIAYMMARRAAKLSQLPSVLNMPDGAYLAVALLAVAGVIARAVWPGSTPAWLAAVPATVLLLGFAMKAVFGGLMLYEGWQRWRLQRKDGGWP